MAESAMQWTFTSTPCAPSEVKIRKISKGYILEIGGSVYAYETFDKLQKELKLKFEPPKPKK